MKVIKLNESISKSLQTKNYIEACKVDLKNVLNCNSLEDLNNIDWKSGSLYVGVIKRLVDEGFSFEEIIDNIEYRLLNVLQNAKSRYAEEVAYEKEIPNVLSKLHSTLDTEYRLLSETDKSLEYEPVFGATHQDCINFVDKVVESVDGKYSGTGRGGSWTMWSILTDKNIRLQAGWSHNDNWTVIIT